MFKSITEIGYITGKTSPIVKRLQSVKYFNTSKNYASVMTEILKQANMLHGSH